MVNILIGYILDGKALDTKWQQLYKVDENGVAIEVIYFDMQKNLVLDSDEKVLFQSNGEKVDVENDWGHRGGTYTYAFKGYLGAGTTIVTNRRIIHYRIPDPLMTGMDYSDPLGGIISGTGPVLKSKEAKKRGMLEFCELSYNNIVGITSFNSDSAIQYYSLTNWERHNYRIFSSGANLIEKQIYEAVVECLKTREIRRVEGKKHLSIIYGELGSIHIKLFWKRDDLIKKANKYRNRKKYDKAIVQYQKILEIFPNDENTKRKIETLSKNKGD